MQKKVIILLAKKRPKMTLKDFLKEIEYEIIIH